MTTGSDISATEQYVVVGPTNSNCWSNQPQETKHKHGTNMIGRLQDQTIKIGSFVHLHTRSALQSCRRARSATICLTSEVPMHTCPYVNKKNVTYGAHTLTKNVYYLYKNMFIREGKPKKNYHI